MPVVGASAARSTAVNRSRARSAKAPKRKKDKRRSQAERSLRRSIKGAQSEHLDLANRRLHKNRKKWGQSDDEIIVGDIKGEESDDSDNESDNGTEESPWQLPHQKFMKDSYLLNSVQYGVAGLIFANFIVSAAEAQVLATEGSMEDDIFKVFDFFFTIIFTVEVLWNLYGHFLLEFWESGWNWFDFVIVVISLMVLSGSNLPGMSIFRLFRAFRVFRLFKRIKSLKLIIEGVFGALPGVSQAFVVLSVLMGIWSILGVQTYGPHDPAHFGNFFKAMFTMFQVMTMDSWSSGIARNIIFGPEDDPNGYAAGIGGVIFFITYIFGAGIVMTNVVVAILLEKYLKVTSGKLEITDNADDDDEDDDDDESVEKKKKKKKKKKKNEGEDAGDPKGLSHASTAP